jgi:Zn-finger nucleic acid-binding protein
MRGALDFLPFGMEPWEYILYLVISSSVYALAGYHWWLIPLLVAILLLWPWAARFLRWLFRRASVGARRSGINRKPGTLYCAECGAPLAPDTNGETSALHVCPACAGKWCLSKELADTLAKKRRTPPEWLAFTEAIAKEELTCPKCFKAMRCGSFRGTNYTTFHCHDCDGYWFNRIDWVSFELG